MAAGCVLRIPISTSTESVNSIASSWIISSCRAARKVSLTMVLLFSCLWMLTGRGANPGVSASSVKGTAALHGMVHGGQQPVSGSTIQLYTGERIGCQPLIEADGFDGCRR